MAGKRSAKKAVAPDLFLKLLQQRFKDVEFVKEFQFHPTRRWRFDYAIPAKKVAVEVDGGV